MTQKPNASTTELPSIALRRFFACVFCLAGGLLLNYTRAHWLSLIHPVAWLGYGYLLLAALLVFRNLRHTGLINLMTVLVTITLTGLVVEGGYYVYKCFQPRVSEYGPFFNRACARYDPVRGFRWIGTECREVRVLHDEVIFNNRFVINNQGYISRQNYQPKKDPASYRWIVFGDSFTAGASIPTPWPQRLQEQLPEHLQVYSFAVDGGGILNWHRTFFNEVIPTYEFDGVMLAVWNDNLDRAFAILHMNEEGGYFKRFDPPPTDGKDFQNQFLPKMKRLYTIKPDAEIDRILERVGTLRFAIKPFDLYLLAEAIEFVEFYLPHFIHVNKHYKSISSSIKPSSQSMANSTNDTSKPEIRYQDQVEQIIEWCLANNKDILLISVPHKDRHRLKSPNKHRHQMQFLSRKYQIPLFDGYQLFDSLSPDDHRDHWFRYDGHWNQTGADYFAHGLSNYLTSSPVKR